MATIIASERATSIDYEGLKSLLDRANAYAEQISGNRMWHAMDLTYGALRDQIEQGDCYLIRREGRGPVAAVCISATDTSMWGPKGQDGRALYVHKLIKDPYFAPVRVGATLLAFAAQQAIHEHKLYLRMDTVSTMTGLLTYYQRLGFVDSGVATYGTGKSATLMEAKAETVLRAVSELMDSK